MVGTGGEAWVGHAHFREEMPEGSRPPSGSFFLFEQVLGPVEGIRTRPGPRSPNPLSSIRPATRLAPAGAPGFLPPLQPHQSGVCLFAHSNPDGLQVTARQAPGPGTPPPAGSSRAELGEGSGRGLPGQEITTSGPLTSTAGGCQGIQRVVENPGIQPRACRPAPALRRPVHPGTESSAPADRGQAQGTLKGPAGLGCQEQFIESASASLPLPASAQMGTATGDCGSLSFVGGRPGAAVQPEAREEALLPHCSSSKDTGKRLQSHCFRRWKSGRAFPESVNGARLG